MHVEKTSHSESIEGLDSKLLRLLVARVEDYAIFMTDPNGYVLSWNLGAQNIKGYKEGEISGKHISDLELRQGRIPQVLYLLQKVRRKISTIQLFPIVNEPASNISTPNATSFRNGS